MHPTWSLALILTSTLIFSFLVLRFIWLQNKETLMSVFQQTLSRFRGKKDGNEHDLEGEPHTESAPTVRPVTMADVARYRYHHGTNLGSVFILERWLTPSMFHDSAKGSSELTAAETWIAVEGLEAARTRFERHWREYVSDADLDWLRDVALCTTIRLPIGYFTLGRKFCEGTEFRKVSGVYENAWMLVRELVARCWERGIGTVIDLHGLPGSTNGQDHSGTDSKKAELWGSKRNLGLAKDCAVFVVQEARTMEGVVGLQIVNEAPWDAKGMYAWYEKVVAEVARVDATLPVYVSDGWNFERALKWSQERNSVHARPAGNPVVVDTHLYWAFSDADKHKSPQQITHEVQTKLSELDGKDGGIAEHGACQAVIGEYSCALTEDSWAKRHDVAKEELVQQFGQAQSRRYQQRSGGSFFWTYRMDWMPGGEWGFREKVEQNAITPSRSLTLSSSDIRSSIAIARQQRDGKRGNTFGAHCAYWDTNFPGRYEHFRFEEGWTLGFEDALEFAGMRGERGWRGGDGIGMLDLWCLKRMREVGVGGKFAWEWEHGFRQGVRDGGEMVGV